MTDPSRSGSSVRARSGSSVRARSRSSVRARSRSSVRARSRYDVVVVGGGVVGLATARAVLRDRPTARIAVLEKEPGVARHQTGRNSGVIHSGIYYRPGSLKATTAVAGRLAMEQFCAEHDVRYEQCGKVIVAIDPRELPRLAELERRAAANGVQTERLDAQGIRAREPAVRGVAGLHVPATGIVAFGEVAEALARELRAGGAEIHLDAPVVGLHERPDEVVVEAEGHELHAAVVVNCAGLHCDQVAAEVLGPAPDVRIVPFRGEYHELRGPIADDVRTLVYPVPDPDLPFLGVHVSRNIDGHVHVGPNAVLALRREGYTWTEVDVHELADLVRFPGFWKLARRYWKVSAEEITRSLSRTALARAVSRMVPGVRAHDLVPSPAGVRAQALGRDGTLHDDFVIRETPRAVHVLNAPSPAATASLVIGQTIAEHLHARL